MHFISCIGCTQQKRSKDDKFFLLDTFNITLIVVNNLRQTYNAKKRKLEKVFDVLDNSKIYVISAIS